MPLVSGVLLVCTHSGHSLVPMDKHGLSDPYCVIYENSKQVRNKIIGTYFQSFPFSYRSYPPVNARSTVFKISKYVFYMK